MRFFQVISTAACLAGVAVAAPANKARASVPSDDGFPTPSAEQLLDIEKKADGTLSNAPPPPKIANSSLTAFQLIAFNELFETAYFSSLIYNITNNVTGFELAEPEKKDELVNILETVLAQEELHAINALGVLEHFGAFAPSPCDYKFPTTDVLSAIALAETFTTLVLGTLQDASQLLAKNGDDGPVRAVASVIGQEGEQNGFYRTLLGLKPSQKPFLTTSVAAYAFSALQQFVASCPFALSEIDLPIFPPLSVVSGSAGANVTPCDQNLTFSADLSGVAGADGYVGGSGEGLWITYLSGQLVPISEPVINVQWDGSVATFDALFPFEENVMEGLSIAALTTCGNFSNPDDLPASTLAAPGLIQVNDSVDNSS
ncbi:Sexual development protein [Pleurostoma richardsiae]|uniref:Sexual development protein n=1 Tax=Pleurostoma richardsiae TaxID=41990 RepID=A0AA38VP27_9PEZI|nr:Sexual development protein [Pleurostoma richardsiae]